MIITAIIVAIIIPISLLVLIPEIVVLYLLTLRGPSPGQIYHRMKASKQTHLPYYDLAVTRMYGMSPGYPGVKMDEVWNPDSTIQITNKEKEGDINRKYSMWKITILSIICTFGFLITSIQSLILYFF